MRTNELNATTWELAYGKALRRLFERGLSEKDNTWTLSKLHENWTHNRQYYGDEAALWRFEEYTKYLLGSVGRTHILTHGGERGGGKTYHFNTDEAKRLWAHTCDRLHKAAAKLREEKPMSSGFVDAKVLVLDKHQQKTYGVVTSIAEADIVIRDGIVIKNRFGRTKTAAEACFLSTKISACEPPAPVAIFDKDYAGPSDLDVARVAAGWAPRYSDEHSIRRARKLLIEAAKQRKAAL